MKTKFYVEAHIPRGSGDAEYRIMLEGTKHVIAVVDPNMDLDEPATVALRIVEAMNADPETIL